MKTVFVEFTGQVAAGKSTLARMIRTFLESKGIKVEYLAPTIKGDTLKVDMSTFLSNRSDD